MVEFTLKNQTTRMQPYGAPSGIMYNFRQGEYLNVEIDRDVEFFRCNNRFLEKCKPKLFSIPEPLPIPKSDEESLTEFLESLGTISQRSVKKLVDTFTTYENLHEAVCGRGDPLSDIIPKKQADIIVQNIQEE